jgi:hypothetical protein
MTAEGSEKTWDQCRIKLKNLKSQYRYVKDRIPNIDEVDLEDEEVLKQLIAECQGRGISPSNIKHLRYLRRFLQKTSDIATIQLKNALEVRSEVLGPVSCIPGGGGSGMLSTSPTFGSSTLIRPIRVEKSFAVADSDSNSLQIDESVSPPSTPMGRVRLLAEADSSSGKFKKKYSLKKIVGVKSQQV